MLELGSQIRAHHLELGAKHPLATEAMETAAIPQWGDRGAPIPKYKRVGKREVPAKETEGNICTEKENQERSQKLTAMRKEDILRSGKHCTKLPSGQVREQEMPSGFSSRGDGLPAGWWDLCSPPFSLPIPCSGGPHTWCNTSLLPYGNYS